MLHCLFIHDPHLLEVQNLPAHPGHLLLYFSLSLHSEVLTKHLQSVQCCFTTLFPQQSPPSQPQPGLLFTSSHWPSFFRLSLKHLLMALGQKPHVSGHFSSMLFFAFGSLHFPNAAHPLQEFIANLSPLRKVKKDDFVSLQSASLKK